LQINTDGTKCNVFKCNREATTPPGNPDDSAKVEKDKLYFTYRNHPECPVDGCTDPVQCPLFCDNPRAGVYHGTCYRNQGNPNVANYLTDGNSYCSFKPFGKNDGNLASDWVNRGYQKGDCICDGISGIYGSCKGKIDDTLMLNTTSKYNYNTNITGLKIPEYKQFHYGKYTTLAEIQDIIRQSSTKEASHICDGKSNMESIPPPPRNVESKALQLQQLKSQRRYLNRII
jgi:hypothetical protein